LPEKDQFVFSPVQRQIAVCCLFLVLIFAAVEAVHVHPGGDVSRHSGNACLICISAHSKAPALTARPLPVLVAVASITIPYETESKGIASRLELFTRPPPLS
jgi:hypothetical protein